MVKKSNKIVDTSKSSSTLAANVLFSCLQTIQAKPNEYSRNENEKTKTKKTSHCLTVREFTIYADHFSNR